MKCRCIDKECHSVTEAVDLIERYEALLGESSDRKRGNVRQVMETKNPLLGENNNDNSANGALIRQLFDRIEKLEHGSGQAKRACFNCNSPTTSIGTVLITGTKRATTDNLSKRNHGKGTLPQQAIVVMIRDKAEPNKSRETRIHQLGRPGPDGIKRAYITNEYRGRYERKGGTNGKTY
jgi:hypothetical protein